MCKDIDFQYSGSDLDLIHNLQQLEFTQEGYYVPVFFNREVLLKYTLNTKYPVKPYHAGGVIQMPSDVKLAFGINENNKVLCWLGDLHKIPKNEQYYFRSENIESDHKLMSGLYNRSILNTPAGSTTEQMLIDEIEKFVKRGKQLWHFDLYDFNPGEIELSKNMTRPVLWDIVALTVNDLFKICIESINVKEIRSRITSDISPKDKENTIMMMKKLLEQELSIDITRTMAPFSIFRRWRNALDHRSSESHSKKLATECAKINLDVNDGPEAMYDRLIEEMINSYQFLTMKLHKLS